MAGNFKNRRLGAGRDFDWSSAQMFIAGEDIAENDIIIATGVNGAFATMVRGDVTNAAKCRGLMWVAKHAVPSGSRGLALPWRRITFATNGSSIGAPVWMTTAGDYTLAGPSTGLVHRRVGTVITAAVDGRIILHPYAFQPSEANQAGPAGASVVVYEKSLTAIDTEAIVVNPAMKVIDVWLVKTDNVGANPSTCVVSNGANPIESFDLNGVVVGAVMRMATIDAGELAFASGDTLNFETTGANSECTVWVSARPA